MTEPPLYTHVFWAKADKHNPERLHRLVYHLADVGACFETLLNQPVIRQRLARAGNIEDLDCITRQRLAAIVALHDIGKINVGFQTRIWDSKYFGSQPKPTKAGHTLDLMPVLQGDDRETATWFLSALGWNEFLQWDNASGATICDLFIATLSHHGSPLQFGTRQRNPGIWRPFGALNPRSYLEHIACQIRQWFPAAFERGGSPLPATPAFQHTFLGLCSLADWIGSDERFFCFVSEPQDNYMDLARKKASRAVSMIGLDLSDQRSCFTAVPDFSRLFAIPGTPSPNAIQQASLAVPLDEKLVVIESETGSGKTEAALLRYAHMFEAGLVDGLYFALPTRAAASQLHRRICRFSDNLFPAQHIPSPVLAIPGYLRAGMTEGKHLPDFQVWWEDEPNETLRNKRWASESSKRFLAAQIAVGTVDQAMMAALRVKHAHMRAACLARNLLIVDEVHASDPYMRIILKALLDAQLGAGGYVILMSATLGSVARYHWTSTTRSPVSTHAISLNEAIQVPYPAITTLDAGSENNLAVGENDKQKDVQLHAMQDMEDVTHVAQFALKAARQGAKVLVIRNTVVFARRTQLALEEQAKQSERMLLFQCKGTTTLHHGQFADTDRKLLDQEVENVLGKERPQGGRIVVGTQTLEQSLDIDADLLITDLCPIDVLLQRIGRLHRHRRTDRPTGFQTPLCAVVLPSGYDLSPILDERLNGLGPHDHVYQDLRILQATQDLVMTHCRSQSPWRIPEMNRELVEKATHPDALQTITDMHGPKWRNHALEIEGLKLADGLTARHAILNRDKTFCEDNQDVVFGDMEERIRTRLGDEGIEIWLEPAPVSPFSTSAAIKCLILPERYVAGVIQNKDPIACCLSDDGFEFRIGKRQFKYDRLGLQQVATG